MKFSRFFLMLCFNFSIIYHVSLLPSSSIVCFLKIIIFFLYLTQTALVCYSNIYFFTYGIFSVGIGREISSLPPPWSYQEGNALLHCCSRRSRALTEKRQRIEISDTDFCRNRKCLFLPRTRPFTCSSSNFSC